MSSRRCSTDCLSKRRNRFSKSYGLVVFTRYPTLRVVIVERKIPYCLTNRLVNKVKKQSFIKNLNSIDCDEKSPSKTLSKSVIEWIRNFIQSFQVDNQKDLTGIKPSDIKDFRNYKSGKMFEDKYDFPHGQMTRRTKTYLNEKIGKSENIQNKNYYVNLLTKFAGFITAFVEFEEETGYTFRFDSDMVKHDVVEMVLKFRGLDGYFYEQHFFMVTVDKLEKMNKNCVNRHRIVATEIDREIYEAKFVEIEEAKKLFYEQERELQKVDLKHTLLCLNFCSLKNESDTDDENCETRNNLDEQIFLDFIKQTEPGVYFRRKSCVRRRRWRDR